MAECGPQSMEPQKNEINTLLDSRLKRGDIWYLIDTKWFKQWKKYVGFDSWDTGLVGEDSAHPGKIDNTPLFKEGTDGLRDHLNEDLDYQLVPEEAWQKLVDWYGLVDGQGPISRKVIEQGMFVKHCKVEVYLMDLKLCENADIDKVVSQQFSRADTIDYIEKEMKTLFNIDKEKEVRLWNKYMSNTYEHLSKPDNTVQDAGLYQGQLIVIEQKNDDGSWPRQTKTLTNTIHNSLDSHLSYSSTSTSARPSNSYGSSSSSYGSYSSFSYGQDGYRSSASPGLCGLSNLGNTCFMNSALQCMSNVPQLTKYFLGDKWRDELNLNNPLGMKGEIATSYAELVRNIWSGKYSYTVPRNFKVSVGRFAPQFSGYQQQDSQELMAFLLDGLHEDLNRIKEKPYIEQKDADNRPDEDVAREAWENYMKRNDSIIVDLFHGLLKSTLVCPECSKVSVTFDPFCYLSLPLPIKKERQIKVFFVSIDPMRKTKHLKLTVPKQGNVSDLCQALSKQTNVPADRMLVADVYNHCFHRTLPHDEGISHVVDHDVIYIYELPVSSSEDPQTIHVPVYMREDRPIHSSYGSNYHPNHQLFGTPLLITVPRNNCTYDVLYNSVINRMARFVKIPDDSHEWWKTPKDESYQNGEVEMNDSSSSDTEEGTSSSTQSKVDGMEDGEEEADADLVNEADRRPYPFTFHLVNSNGSSTIESVKNDGSLIKFSNRPYVGIDWHPKAKELFYDEMVAEDQEVDESVSQRTMQKRQTIQLSECLEMFTTTEKLGEQDPWYCPRCKKHQQATKKFDLWTLPKILVIHLKRFSYNRYFRDKLDTIVEYPTSGLNMKKYIINKSHCPAVYDLIAVSNHYGGMGGGHYTAYGRNKEEGRWYNFDDSSVSESSEEGVVTKAGYVLVYHLRHGSSTNDKIPSASGVATQNIETVTNGADHNNSNEDDMDIS